MERPSILSSFNNVFQHSTSVIALITATSFALTAVREWVYFTQIGQDFIMMTTISDYASLAIRWIPMAAAVYGATMLISITIFVPLLDKLMRPANEDIGTDSSNPEVTKPKQSKVWPRVKKLRPSLVTYILLFCLLGFAAFTIEDLLIKVFMISLYLLAITSQYWALKAKTLTTIIFGQSFTILIFATAIIAKFGYYEGVSDMETEVGNYRIVLMSGETEDALHLLRATTTGVLVLQTKGRTVSFHNYESFSKIEFWDSSENISNETNSAGDEFPNAPAPAAESPAVYRAD